MDCRPLGSSVYGILQARILQWIAIPFSSGSPEPRDCIWVYNSFNKAIGSSVLRAPYICAMATSRAAGGRTYVNSAMLATHQILPEMVSPRNPLLSTEY